MSGPYERLNDLCGPYLTEGSPEGLDSDLGLISTVLLGLAQEVIELRGRIVQLENGVQNSNARGPE